MPIKLATLITLLLAITACSKDPDNFKLQCYGEHSLSKNNALIQSKDLNKNYEFVNKSISDNKCTYVDKTIQCSKISDDGKTNHYLIFNQKLETMYETTITISKTNNGEERLKEVFQGKCQTPIF